MLEDHHQLGIIDNVFKKDIENVSTEREMASKLLVKSIEWDAHQYETFLTILDKYHANISNVMRLELDKEFNACHSTIDVHRSNLTSQSNIII